MSDQIRPITTRYKGYRFRSRLEARWAVFLDSLGVPWDYEVEGYVFPDGTRYLPDFWLPESGVFFEIKPGGLSFDAAEEAAHKAESLAIYKETTVFLATGAPDRALIDWFSASPRVTHLPVGERFVAFDYDEQHRLPVVWAAVHEPHYEDVLDPWGREYQFARYSGGFFASTYLVCHPGHEALTTRRPLELAGASGPDELPLSDRARKAIAAARSARFEFGESGPA